MSKKTKLTTIATIVAGYTAAGHKPTKVEISYGINQSLVSDVDSHEQKLTATCHGTNGVHQPKVVVELWTGHTRVSCNCEDYKFTFARANKAVDAHLGKLPKYAPVKGTGKPRNPGNVVGGCKHIVALINRAQRLGMLGKMPEPKLVGEKVAGVVVTKTAPKKPKPKVRMTKAKVTQGGKNVGTATISQRPSAKAGAASILAQAVIDDHERDAKAAAKVAKAKKAAKAKLKG